MSKILVIEDDLTIGTLIVRLLQAEKYEVLLAREGHSGLELAQTEEPDLILCDIMMPEMDGYEVLEHLRQTPQMSSIPFIFLTAKSERSEQRLGMELGADDYLSKPFTRDELLGAIAARLKKKAAVTQPYLTELKRVTDSLSLLPYLVSQSNLPNRLQLHHWLQRALERAKQTQRSVAVLMLGFGASCADGTCLSVPPDALLQAATNRLAQSFKLAHPVAQISSREFGLVFDSLAPSDQPDTLTQHIRDTLLQPYAIDGQQIQANLYLGLAMYPNHGSTAQELMQRAEVWMNRAKQATMLSLGVYAAEQATAQTSLAIRAALERHEFFLEYEPQIRLTSGRMIGVEALLRWRHPERGILYPNEFLAIAEAQQSLIPLSNWVLRTACTDASRWQSRRSPSIEVSVNLSGSYFRRPGFGRNNAPPAAIADMTAILRETGLSPSLLTLDLSETTLMENGNLSLKTLEQLDQLGVQLFLDDFGTGFSCIASLKRFPLDGLKIDRAFLKEITTNSEMTAIVRAILAMAQNLSLKVIAEGVETEQQLLVLKQLGCYAARGYYFSPPVSAEQIEAML